MIERVRSVRKIALVALALVFIALVSVGISSMLAPSTWASEGNIGNGMHSGTGATSRDKWVLGDADATNEADIESVFVYGNGSQGWAANADKGSEDNHYHPGGELGDGWPAALTDPNSNWNGTNTHTLNDPIQHRSRIRQATEEAIHNCQLLAQHQAEVTKKPATCNRPRVVAMGSAQFTGGKSKGKCLTEWCLDANSGNLSHSILDTFGTNWNQTISIDGNEVKLTDALAGSYSIESDSVCAVWGGDIINNDCRRHGIAQGQGKGFAVIVVGEFQYEQKGWYPHWSPSHRVDLATANKISSHQLAPCAAYYYMTATGTDGYVRGYTTKTVKYHTPYGKLYDAVQQGKTWTASNGKSYGPFIGDWSYDEAKLNELQEARDVACNETQNMKIVFNYEANGSSPDATESDESTSTPGKSDDSTITVLGKNDFKKKFAKGGIYKVTKSKKDATLTAKTTDVKTFYRLSDWFEFDGWIECKKNDTITAGMMGLDNAQSSISWRTWNGNKCGLIGEKKPANAPAGLSRDPRDDFRTGTADWGFFSGVYNDVSKDGNNSGDWNELDPKTGKDIYNQVLNNPGNVYVTIPNVGYKEISALFNRGYVTKYNCGGEEFDAKDFGNNGTMASQSDCTAVAWNFQNDPLAWATATKSRTTDSPGNVRIVWNAGGQDAWKYGMPLHGAAVDTLNGQLHPVGNSYQSIVAIAYQDFLNINCNKRDFDAFVNQVSNDAVNAGVPENLTLRDNKITDTKYNGRANTGVITKELADRLHWDGLPQIVPRVLGQSWITIRADGASTDRFITGLSAKQVTGQDSPTIYDAKGRNVSWDKYIKQLVSSPINYWSAYDASRDPVYSKECPFDCTDDRNSKNLASAANVMTDRNNPTDSDLAIGGTGVLATNSDSNGGYATRDSVNTANMVFFRNNEWNKFVVDLYTPKAGTSNAGDISYDGNPAKSTIITRDPDGTPWFAADANKTILTHLQPLQGTYKNEDIFTNDAKHMSDAVFNQQLSNYTDTTGIDQMSVQLSGQINQFRIKSAWATENGHPLKFQMKWEYDANDHVSVPSTISFQGTGTVTGNIPGNVHNDDTISTVVDGKCLSQQNTLDHTPDTTDLNHNNSGSGAVDNDDAKFDTFQLAGSRAARGWFGITFVRATAE